MTTLLPKFLQYAFAGPHERRDIAEKYIPRDLTCWHDDKVVAVRELLQSEAIESTTLIQTEVYNTVMEGAEPFKCFRDAVQIFRCNSNVLRIVKGESGTYAPVVAEGSEIPIDTQDYGYTDFTITKKGVRPVITRELIEDGLFDVVAMEVRKAGSRIENKLNQDMLTVLLDNAGNEQDTGGSNQGIKALASARGLIKADGFIADTAVLSPEFEALLLKEFVPTDYTGSQQVMASGTLGNALGMRLFTCGVTDASSTYTWEYNSDSDIGAVVFDRTNAGGIAMRRDISVERYNDPIRDLVGASVTARFGVNYLQANAISRVEY